MTENFATEIFFPYLFGPLFLVFWLAICAALHFVSGWHRLQQHFPDRDQDAWATMRFQSGKMGRALLTGVSYGNCLRFEICPDSLSIKLLWIFGPWAKPIFVPWPDISCRTEQNMFLVRFCRMSFGRPEVGDLTIGQGAARKIARLSQGKFAEPFTAPL